MMARVTELLPSLLFVVVIGCGCATTEVEKTETITGTVTYPERIEMPLGAVVEVKLVEVHRGANRTIVEKNIANPGKLPVTFSLTYNPKEIRPGQQYAVQARIVDEGKAWYVTQTVNHHMRDGRIAHADVILQPAR